jgi:ribosomal protein L31
MKEGIHPSYREVCFVDLSNGFKFVTRSCAQTKETVKMDERASTRSAAVSRNSATSSPTSRSELAPRMNTKAATAAFFVGFSHGSHCWWLQPRLFPC